nr:MAG TPA: ATP-dependent Clp protease ATP-binding subunit [Caudoviricetes sp.]
MKRYSILNNLGTCYFCGKPRNAIHEVYFRQE